MINVLLVEEDSLSREKLGKLVPWKEYGYEIVAQADNGVQALKVIRSRRIDLVIMELPLYGLSENELVNFVKQHCNHTVHFAVISEFEDFKLAQAALRLGALEYLVKPVKKEDLHLLINSMSRRYQREHEIEIRKETYEQIKYRRAVIHVLLGKYSEEEMHLVQEKLYEGKNCIWRLVTFEIQNPADGMEAQNTCIIYLKKLLKRFSNHVVPLISSGKTIFGAGVILNSEVVKKMHMQENELIHYFRIALEQHLNYEIQVYIGMQVFHLSSMVESFRSINVMRLLSINGMQTEKVLSYEELNQGSVENVQRKPVGKIMVKDLTEAIMSEDVQAIESTIDRISTQLASSDMTLGRMSELLISTISSYKEIIEQVENTDQQSEVLQWIGAKYLHKFVQYGNCEKFKDYVVEYSKYFHQRKKEEKKSIVDQIDDYVIKHYNLPLSLKSLGEQFYVNSVYLGQLYKKKYGISFKEYLTDLRINKSIELLEDTNLRVYEIAKMVGFQNPDYFINKFVKAVGKTPQQHRLELSVEDESSKLQI